MKTIICDALRTLTVHRNHAETPKYIQNLVLYHQSCTSSVRLLYDELKSEYQWLHCILKMKRTESTTDSQEANNAMMAAVNAFQKRRILRLNPSKIESELQDNEETDILNITNIAVLFCHSDDITFLMEEQAELNEQECSALMKDLVSMFNMSLDVKIRYLWPSTMPSTTKSHITNASIGLYGTDYRRYFDAKSVSFSTGDSEFNADTQHRFQSTVQVMIQQLLRVPIAPVPTYDITSSPSASTLKILLTRIGEGVEKVTQLHGNDDLVKLEEPLKQVINDMMIKYQYSAEKLEEEMEFLEEEHGIDFSDDEEDGAPLQVAHDYFNQALKEQGIKHCDRKKCPLILYHYLHEDELDDSDNEADLTLTAATIHYNLLHKWEFNRMTEKERENWEMRLKSQINIGMFAQQNREYHFISKKRNDSP